MLNESDERADGEFAGFGQGEEAVSVFGEWLAIREMIQRHVGVQENFILGFIYLD